MNWTPRNTMNVVLVLIALAAIAYVQLGGPLPDWPGLTPATVSSGAGALIAGLMIPGSPIGRMLDQVFPTAAGPRLSLEQAEQLVAQLRSSAPPPRPRSSTRGGFVDVHLLAEIVFGFVLVAGAAALLHGCGASAFRAHATAAHDIHDAIEGAGAAILVATHARLEACPHDDGIERTQCIDSIEREATAAAALRDALILPSNAYRAELLQACGVDPQAEGARVPDDCPDPPADVMVHVLTVGASAWHDWPAFSAAMRALGAEVPDVTRPGGV